MYEKSESDRSGHQTCRYSGFCSGFQVDWDSQFQKKIITGITDITLGS